MRRGHRPESSGHARALRLVDVSAVVGLTALAAALRVDALRPSSLWIDDAWAALVVKAHSIDDVFLVGVTAPAFAVLLKGWLAVAGFSELNAQLLPFVAGVAAVPGVYLVARWRGVGWLGALAGALVLAASVVHMTYSTRVKQYTLDCLVALVVLAVALWLVEDVERRRRWWVFTAACIGGIALSSPAIVLAVSCSTVALVALARRQRTLRAAAPVTLVGLFAGLWWLLLLRPRVNDALRDYWSGYFVPHDEGVGRAIFIAARDAKDVFAGAVPPNFTAATLAALAVPVAVVVLLACRRYAIAALLVVAPVGVALSLAVAQAVPLGTGRTDMYLYPGLALAIAMAVDLARQRWARPTVVAVATILVVQVVVFEPGPEYPSRDLKPLVAELERRTHPDDSVLVRPDDDFAVGLYTRWPIRFVRATDPPTGFAVEIAHDGIHAPLILPVGTGDHTETWRAAIAKCLERSSRVWLIAGGHEANPKLPYVRRLLREAGLSRVLELTRPGGNLTLWAVAS
jgi:hypothetical protein